VRVAIGPVEGFEKAREVFATEHTEGTEREKERSGKRRKGKERFVHGGTRKTRPAGESKARCR